MSARDDFRPASADGTCTEAVWGPMCDEIDRLRGWKAEAITVIDKWERCFDLVEQMGFAGPLGGFKSDHVLATIEQLCATQHVDRDEIIGRLVLDLDEARDSANRWAYKMTLLVGWVRNNCTPEQVAAARAWGAVDQQ